MAVEIKLAKKARVKQLRSHLPSSDFSDTDEFNEGNLIGLSKQDNENDETSEFIDIESAYEQGRESDDELNETQDSNSSSNYGCS